MCHQSLIFSLIPPLNPVVLCNICAEPLTMEMELDECICVDCAAEAALQKAAQLVSEKLKADLAAGLNLMP